MVSDEKVTARSSIDSLPFQLPAQWKENRKEEFDCT